MYDSDGSRAVECVDDERIEWAGGRVAVQPAGADYERQFLRRLYSDGDADSDTDSESDTDSDDDLPMA